MVAPVTNTSYEWRFPFPNGAKWAKTHKTSGRRQKKPYDLLLPYEYTWAEAKPTGNTSWDGVTSTGNTTLQTRPWSVLNPSHNAYLSSYQNWAIQQCRSRLMSMVGERAGLLVSLAERQSTMKMMENRLFQMYRGFRHLLRFEFQAAARSMLSQHDKLGWEVHHRKMRSGKFKRGAKYAANNVLEMHYGWMPLLMDLNAASHALSGESPDGATKRGEGKVEGKGKYEFSRTFTQSGGLWCTHKGVLRVRSGASISVENPNVFLADQLGLINPYLAVVDLVKFSFLFDYLVNLSEFFGQFTDFAGLNVADQYWTVSCKDETTWTWPGAYSGGGKSFTLKRNIGALPATKLSIRKPWQLSPRRGLALAALCVQALPDSPPREPIVRPSRRELKRYRFLGSLGNEYFR